MDTDTDECKQKSDQMSIHSPPLHEKLKANFKLGFHKIRGPLLYYFRLLAPRHKVLVMLHCSDNIVQLLRRVPVPPSTQTIVLKIIKHAGILDELCLRAFLGKTYKQSSQQGH